MCQSVPVENVPECPPALQLHYFLYGTGDVSCETMGGGGFRCGRVKLLVGTYIVGLSETCFGTLMSR
jgi:hypothetical protein